MTNAIEAEGLVKRFGKTTALDGVDLAVPGGKILGMLGPNGAGKTTAVRILATLLRPDAGHARVAGYDVVKQSTQVRSLVGLTGQYASLDEEMSATENLVLLGRLLGLSRGQAKLRSAELLDRFGLTDAAKRAVKTYSGGMRRRADLAASLIGRPDVLYLDEPTTGLDPHSRNEVWDTIRTLVSEGVTVLLTTQYLDEADQLADLITVVDHGKIIATGRPDELKRHTGGQTLQVRPTLAADLDAVTAILVDLTQAQPTRDEDTGLLTVPVADPMLLSAVVRRLDDAGITADELALRLPSLDEVFLSLTDRKSTSDTPADRVPEGSNV